MDFYGVKHTKTKAIFYKAVHKNSDGIYYSDYDKSFHYKIGSTYTNNCDVNIYQLCGYGLHIAHMNWALDFGRNWSNLAIIEVETKISDIIMPKGTDGTVRTSKLKVLREVPLDECGLFGKILAHRKNNTTK